MIDNPEKAEILMERLKNSLPIEARLSQHLIRTLMKKSPDVSIPDKCNITAVLYSGDMGGILCALDIGGSETESVHLVSITHLSFDRRTLLARDIEVYQRHRTRKLKQQISRGY
ncbi:MAG TPA: hypothetical protein VIJ94_18790 [Caulobacteraceae bacterium]